MKYRNSIIVLGFLVIIIPFLGFPSDVRQVMSVLSGAGVVALAYLAGKRS